MTKYFLYAILFLVVLHANVMAMSDGDCESTETWSDEYDDDEAEDIPPPLLDMALVIEDLKTPKSVRCQINNIFALLSQAPEMELLSYPVVCIGTGRSLFELKTHHSRPTIVRDDDICIDVTSRLKPDVVDDAFDLPDLRNAYGTKKFGVVFFAHVANQAYALRQPRVAPSFAIYAELLIESGWLIFVSEVYRSEDHLLQAIDYRGFASIDLLAASWRSMFKLLGLEDVSFITRDERATFGKEATSLVLFARKP